MNKPLPKSKSLVPDTASSQVDEAYDLIRDWIITCRLKPGLRLQLRELLDQTQMGRTPVREAMLRLEQDGLIITKPRSGYQVKPMTEKSIRDFFTVWRTIGPLIFCLAMERMDGPTLSRLEKIVSPLNQQRLTPMAHCRVRRDLFFVLAHTTGNEHLIHISHRLSAEMERLFLIFFSEEKNAKWFDRGDIIMAILTSGDREDAERRVYETICLAEAAIISAFLKSGNRYSGVAQPRQRSSRMRKSG